MQAGIEQPVQVIGDERGGDHRGEELRGLSGLEIDGHGGVVERDARCRPGHGGSEESEALAEELPGDVEVRPRIESEATRQRRREAEVHELARVLVGAPDPPIDPSSPELGDPFGRQEDRVLTLHLDKVDPLEVRIVIRAGAFGQGRRVRDDVSRLVDVLHLVGNAVQVAEDLTEQPAPNLVAEVLRGDLVKSPGRFLGGDRSRRGGQKHQHERAVGSSHGGLLGCPALLTRRLRLDCDRNHCGHQRHSRSWYRSPSGAARPAVIVIPTPRSVPMIRVLPLVAVLVGGVTTGGDEVGLPAPSGLDLPVGEALRQRRSTRSFDGARRPSKAQLGALLWAAAGVNRPDPDHPRGGKRTAPSAFGAGAVDILVATSDGVFRYSPARHALTPLQRGDLRPKLTGAAWAREAPLSSSCWSRTATAIRGRWRLKSACAMRTPMPRSSVRTSISARRPLGLGTVLTAGVAPRAGELLDLGKEQRVVFVLPVGYERKP